jgi:hypothetical protein
MNNTHTIIDSLLDLMDLEECIEAHGWSPQLEQLFGEELRSVGVDTTSQNILSSIEDLQSLIKKNIGFTSSIADKYIKDILGNPAAYKLCYSNEDTVRTYGKSTLKIMSVKEIRLLLREVNSWSYIVGLLGEAVGTNNEKEIVGLTQGPNSMLNLQLSTSKYTNVKGELVGNMVGMGSEITLKKSGWCNKNKIEALALLWFKVDEHTSKTHEWLAKGGSKYKKFANVNHNNHNYLKKQFGVLGKALSNIDK